MNLSPEEKKVGRDNYYEAVQSHDKMQGREIAGVNRRDFLKEVIGAGAIGTLSLGAMYFGYQNVGNPLRVGIIGTGDEGNVLIGALNPNYVDVVAISDIRPSSIHRAFHGDWSSPAAIAARPGLMSIYGWNSEDEAKKHVKVYDKDYHDLLKDSNVEAVIIALPLHLHAPAAIDAMKAGKHVLTEKLMAHNIAQCKVMARVSEQTGLYLATGHQRHYSILYDNAVNLIRWGLLGEIHHIRAQWHRNNLPGSDSWAQPIPGGEPIVGSTKSERFDRIAKELANFKNALKDEGNSEAAALLEKKIAQWTAWDSDKTVKAEDYDYQSITLEDGRNRSALEELIRWRLWDRTGGGLMAELGSHQLDAASIFISALRADGKKAHPLTVYAVGGRSIFPRDRDADDHVYCMFEFPGPGYVPGFDVGYYDRVLKYPNPEKGIPAYDKDNNKKIVVTYSSINGSGFGGYGEIVMGTKGELVLEREQEVMLYKDSSTTTNIKVKGGAGGPALDTQDSGGGGPVAKAAETGPISRGYKEEIEHWAYCIRNPSPENQPRCRPEVAMGDAVIALTARMAAKNSMVGKSGYTQFDEAWFDVHRDETPDGSSIEEEKAALKA
jgi:predicted dehydrogenase